MKRTTQTALVTIFGALLAVPAAAQSADGNMDCPQATFETDADRDSVVSAEEARTAAEREFARFDVNQDEKITRDEFVGCFAVPTTDTTSEQAQGEQAARGEEDFARADLDKDGKVDRAEFGLGAQQAFDEALGMAATGAPAGEDTGQVATEQDVPGANMAAEPLTDEAQAVTGETGAEVAQGAEAGQDAGEPGRRAPQIVQERFLQSPYADFPTVADRELTAEEIASNTAGLFLALDRDRDFALTKDEWTSPAATDRQASAGAAFERLDRDSSGSLEPEEYVQGLVDVHREASRAMRESGYDPQARMQGAKAQAELANRAAGTQQGPDVEMKTSAGDGEDDAQAAATGAKAQAELANRATGTQQGPNVEMKASAGDGEDDPQAAQTGAMAQAELADRAAGTQQTPDVEVEAPAAPGQADAQVSMGQEGQAASQAVGVPIFLYRVYRF